MIKLQLLGEKIISKPKDEVTIEQMKDFIELLVDITNQNKVASSKVEDATKLVLSEIEFKGFDFKEYFSKINE